MGTEWYCDRCRSWVQLGAIQELRPDVKARHKNLCALAENIERKHPDLALLDKEMEQWYG
jgi:hypothetical protein